MNYVTCAYCSKPTALVGGDELYPHRPDLSGLKFHQCLPCGAYVGCHKVGAFIFVDGKKIVSDGTLPLGRLANAGLRRAKQAAHAAFDPLWRGGQMPRRHAYSWLAQQLNLAVDDTHIGNFNIAQCHAVVAACHMKATT